MHDLAYGGVVVIYLLIMNKHIKMNIVSDISRPQSVAYTKAVHGVSVDPHQEYRIASYVDVSHRDVFPGKIIHTMI